MLEELIRQNYMKKLFVKKVRGTDTIKLYKNLFVRKVRGTDTTKWYEKFSLLRKLEEPELIRQNYMKKLFAKKVRGTDTIKLYKNLFVRKVRGTDTIKWYDKVSLLRKLEELIRQNDTKILFVKNVSLFVKNVRWTTIKDDTKISPG